MKRRIIIALDRYEDLEIPPEEQSLFGGTNNREEGITQGAFIYWFRSQKGNEKYTYQQVDKCINDCREDKYINYKYVNGNEYAKPIFQGGVFKEMEYGHIQVENIWVSSPGRELLKWYYFYPVFLKKVSFWEAVGMIAGAGFVLKGFSYIPMLVSGILKLFNVH